MALTESSIAAPQRLPVVRNLALIAHRWIGLSIAGFLVLTGLTGSVLAFNHELDVWLNPSLLRDPEPTRAALHPLELLERLEARLPDDLRVSYVALDRKPGDAAAFYVEVPESRRDDDEYFLSPSTGELLGSRRWGEIAQGRRNLIPFIYRLHYSLALGDAGQLLLGVIALLWTLDCFVSVLLTLPPAPSTGDKRLTRASWASWLARWSHSWRVKGPSLFALAFTWHRACGLWLWAMFFVYAWSAVGLNLSTVYRPVTSALFGMADAVEEGLPDLDPPRERHAVSWRRALAIGRAEVRALAASRGFRVLHERGLHYDAAHGVFEYLVRSSLDVSDRYPTTSVFIDGETGALRGFEAPTGSQPGNTVTTWIYQLHFGAVAGWGMAYRVFVCLMGLAVTVLSVTGVWMWARRRGRDLQRAQRSKRS